MSNGGPVDGTLLKSLTFAIAMSFHSVLEGFALGVQVRTSANGYGQFMIKNN
jgi:zinc transporter ZupT